MLILFDHVTPRGIARFVPGHTVTKAKGRGWDMLTNGELPAAAERAGFDVLLTVDKNMCYQQNSCRPQNSPCGVEHSAMAGCSLASWERCGSGKLCHARLLYRS